MTVIEVVFWLYRVNLDMVDNHKDKCLRMVRLHQYSGREFSCRYQLDLIGGLQCVSSHPRYKQRSPGSKRISVASGSPSANTLSSGFVEK